MWSLLDYKAFQRMVEVGYFSQKTHVEYDCGAKQLRGLSLSLHAQRMGEGKVITKTLRRMNGKNWFRTPRTRCSGRSPASK